MITRDGDRLKVAGPLTIETVSALSSASLELRANSMLEVDLGQVEAVDSSAVSLLLSWVRRSQRGGVALCISNAPENLLSLARLYGVAEMLPLCADASAQS